MTKIWILIMMCLTSLLGSENYWQGSIGKSKIYLELNCNIDKVTEEKNACRFSRYFYQSQLQDIVMKNGEKIGENGIRLQVVHHDKIQEEFMLKYDNGKLKGHWKSKGKTLSAKLKPLVLNDKYDAFEQFRRKFLKFKRAKVEKLKKRNKELVWIKEVHADSMFFRLGNGFSKTSRTKVNPVLDELQNEFSVGTLSCASSWNYGTGMEPIKSDLTYLTDDLIGVSFLLNYFCGGPYPDFNTRRYLYDLHSGKEYALKDILTIANNPSRLRELAFKAEGTELKAQAEADGKGGYDPYELSYWENIDWQYEKKGIQFFLNFSTAERCYRGDSYLIPFELLRPYKNKEFPYVF